MPTEFPEYATLDHFPDYRFHRDGVVTSCRVRGSKVGRKSDVWLEVKSHGNSRRQYLYVTLRTPDGKKTMRVNVLILWAFSGSRPEGMEAAHKDGNRLNNRIENLVWKTHQQNIADKVAHGTQLRGSDIVGSKLVESQVLEIKSLVASGSPKSHVASRFGVSDSLVRLIVKGKRWSHLELANAN